MRGEAKGLDAVLLGVTFDAGTNLPTRRAFLRRLSPAPASPRWCSRGIRCTRSTSSIGSGQPTAETLRFRRSKSPAAMREPVSATLALLLKDGRRPVS